jgi:hypothetical protein
MRRLTYRMLALASFALIGCSSSSPSSGQSAGGSSSGGSPSGGASPTAGAGASAVAGGGSAGMDGLPTPPGSMATAMPIISHGVPAFASSNDPNATPAKANDGNPATSWSSTATAAWLAYDLSGVPVAERGEVLIAWYDEAAADYINTTPTDPSKHLPIDYTLETNMAPGGGNPPTDGWTTVDTVTGNNRSTRQVLVDIMGANWVRMNITKSSDPNIVQVDLDVQSAPDGATDSWLFMGDSITFLWSTYAFSDLPELVNGIDSTRWPAVVPAAIGGTNTTTAMAAIQDTMSNYPGRFVVLAYGTNDHPTEFHMEELVQAVIAAGKVPVVPHMPWAADANIQMSGPLINAQIDALYVKYPAILKGPDFWAIFNGRTDLIPATDIHPNDAGEEEFRKQWAMVMAP